MGRQGRNGAAHAHAAALGQVALRGDRLDAQERLLARAGDVELGQQVLGGRDEVRTRARPQHRRGGEEGLGVGFHEGVRRGGLVFYLRGAAIFRSLRGVEVVELDGQVMAGDQDLVGVGLRKLEVGRGAEDVGPLG